jgi:hypothetical protein
MDTVDQADDGAQASVARRWRTQPDTKIYGIRHALPMSQSPSFKENQFHLLVSTESLPTAIRAMASD